MTSTPDRSHSEPCAPASPVGTSQRLTLDTALTVYLAPGEDRTQVARLIDAMCRLNGIVVAIEIHTGEDRDAPASPPATPPADAEAWLRENDCGADDCRICRAMQVRDEAGQSPPVEPEAKP